MTTARALAAFAFTLALATLLAGCAEPVPQARIAYVGEWRGEKDGEKILLEIKADGYISYMRRSANARTTINAPIKRFDGDNFVVGFGPFNTTFVVSKAPHLDGAVWKMTVDGVELRRGPGAGGINA
jgi:hypothetical protein